MKILIKFFGVFPDLVTCRSENTIIMNPLGIRIPWSYVFLVPCSKRSSFCRHEIISIPVIYLEVFVLAYRSAINCSIVYHIFGSIEPVVLMDWCW